MTSSDYQIPQSLYDRLHVHPDASKDEIIKAYRKQARKYHPDKTLDSKTEEWMKLLNEAKDILLSEKRSDYDEKLFSEGNESVCEPLGYLPEGIRLSRLFISIYNGTRISFEAGLLRDELADFSPLLQEELKRRPIQKPPLTFNNQVCNERPKRHTMVSPLTDVLAFTKGAQNDQKTSMHINPNLSLEQLLDILRSSKEYGTNSNLPPNDGMVSIINVTNLSDESITLFLSIFVDLPSGTIPNRNDVLKQLSKFVPYANMQQQLAKPTELSNCATCSLAFNLFSWAHYTCYHCRRLLCKTCPVKVVLTSRFADIPRPLCSHCLISFNQQDIDDWTKKSVQFIEIGTLDAIRAALGCLTIALCLSDFSTKPVIKVVQAFLHQDMPELAISFVSSLLEYSEDPKETLRIYVLCAEIFKALANNPSHSSEMKWNLLLAAKESCNLALETASCLNSSVELPTLVSVQKEITNSLDSLRKKQELVQKCEINMICSQMEACWQKRDWKQLLELTVNGTKASVSFLPHIEDKTIVALEYFIASKINFVDKMLPDDRYGLIFLQVILNIQKDRFSDALCDLEKLAYHSHYHIWLSTGIADLFLGLVTDKPYLFFPRESLNKVLQGKILMDSSDTDYHQNRFSLLRPRNSELTPPFTSQWPELGVEGLNTKPHIKFEKAVVLLLDEGRWNEWDAAMAYINYVPACSHPAEAALCFSYAAMWLLKQLREHLGSSMTPPLSEVFATKNMIMNCIQSSLGLCIRFLHPGIQFYVCRLCLGVAMQTMQLTGSLAIKYEAQLITTLLHLTMYSSRFNPVWNFPSIPLSEAVLLSIKSIRYHLNFLLGLQYIQDDKRPVSRSEMFYQIHENNLRGVCRLENPAGARARAMEEMLSDKGWTWTDVINLMVSPLSPRDSEGWLIQQKSLGVSMPFAKLTGFVFNVNADSPSIEIVAIPADPSNGLVGLFSMEDIQTVLQLASSDAYPIHFSLDPPNLHQKYHPFQEWCYEPKELQNSLFLHTLFEADYLLKSFSVGAEVSSKPPFESRPCKVGLTKNLPLNLVEAIKPVAERGGTSSQHVHRFWIQADVVEYNVTESGPRIEFDLTEPTMHIRSHPIIPGPDGKYHDTEFEDDPESPEAKFAFDLTCHYNELGKYFPVFARLRELAKLQTLVPLLVILKRNLKDKADGNGLEVLLSEIQQDIRQRHQDGIEDILKQLDADINSGCQQKEDEKVLNDITDLFLEICEHRLSQDDIKRSVNQWLLLRNSSSATELRDLVCSVLPLPSNKAIMRDIIQPHHQKIHSTFEQKLDSITSPPSKVTENPCKWVPAAALKDESDTLKHYGGVVMPLPRIQPGSQEQVPTLLELLKRILCVPFQVERTHADTTFDAAAPIGSSFSAPEGPFTPASCSESTDEDNQDSESSAPDLEGDAFSTTRPKQQRNSSTGATDSPRNHPPDSSPETRDNVPNISSNETSFHAKVYVDNSNEQCERAGSCHDSSPHVDSVMSNSTCDCEENCSHIGSSHSADSKYAHTNPQFHKTESKSVHTSDFNSSASNTTTSTGNDDHAAAYYCSSDSDSESNEFQPSVNPCKHTDADSNRQNSSLLDANSNIQPVPDNDACNYSGNENNQINNCSGTHHTTSGFVHQLNPVECESTIQWRHPGYGMKALSTGESTPNKAAVSAKVAHPCALYTKLRYVCTDQKYKEYLSIEREGRLRVKRLLETFNISNHNINIHAVSASTADAQKSSDRGSALLADINKHQDWITCTTKKHSGTEKANVAVKEANRLANANSPCRITGCQCCDVMAQSNVCSDDDGCQSYRAELTKEVNCRSSNVVYLIRCRRSGKNIHIGQTKEELHECLNQYRTRKGSVVYEHFTSKGFSFDDMEVVILADIDDDRMREEKQVEWMKKITKRGCKRHHKEGTK